MHQARDIASTIASNAETRPDVFVHPRSPRARSRATFYVTQARRCIAVARAHRIAGRADWARSALAAAALCRSEARIEYRVASWGA